MESEKTTLGQRRKREIRRAAVIFLLPALLFMAVYVIYPIVDTFRISLYRWNGISAYKEFIALKNWFELLKDHNFWAAFRNNVVIVLLSIAIQIPVGLLLATFIEFGQKRTAMFKNIWMLPGLLSSVAIGFLFRYELAVNGGILSTISNTLGGKNIDLLGNSKYALYVVACVIAWQYIPMYMVHCMAGYSRISKDVYEAAVIDGAGRGQYFIRIVIPVIKPVLKSAAILSMIGSLKYFELVYVMTGGGPGTSTEVMATYMYKYSFSKFNIGYGATIAAGMFLVILIVTVVVMRIMVGKEDMQ